MSTSPPASKFADLSGLQLHYLDWGGQGTPLVMLHGFTGHAHTWDLTAAALRDQYRVLAVDQRGHGDSNWASRYGSRPMVDDLLHFLDALELDRVVLMGLSMGGNVAYLVAGSHPDRVERLIILDIGPEISPVGLERISQSLGQPDVFASEDEAVAQARAVNARPTDANLRHRVAYNLRPRPDGMLTFKWDKALRDGKAVREEPTPEERWRAWRAINCPVLLVRGADSDILSPETAQRMVEANANVTLAIVPDCGHSITLDRPEGLIAAVTPWLAAPVG
jgi:pimeloyl-ACP methyl ester carboxylesterase